MAVNVPEPAGKGAAASPGNAGTVGASAEPAGEVAPARAGEREPGRARGARERFYFRVAMAAVVAATVAVRLWPLLTRHMLGGLIEYDDGVYYDASAHLAGGMLPYRDFVFLQPPGIAVLLAPFAGLARLAGDPAAMIAARLGMILVASVNTVLLVRLVRRWSGPVAAVAAGAAYAAWGGAAATERTVLLEPLLGLCLLGALTLLRPGGRTSPGRWRLPACRVAAAGAVLGLALTVKTWAVLDVVVLTAWLLWRSGRRAALVLPAAAVGTATAVCLPFFLAAPGAMISEVIADQLGRTQKLTPDPMVYLHEVTGVGQPYGTGGAGPLAAGIVVAAAVVAVVVTLWRGPRIWAVLAAAQVGLVLPQNSYTYHYIDFAAPMLAACAGVTTAALLRGVRRAGRPAVALTAAAAAAGLGLLAFQAVDQDVIGSPVPASLGSFLSAHPCAFSDYPALLAAAGAETSQVRDHCRNPVDYTGAALAAADGRMLVAYDIGGRRTRYRPLRWQAQVRGVLAGSDAAVLSWRPQDWTPATWQFFGHRFRRTGQAGSFTMWTLRTPNR